MSEQWFVSETENGYKCGICDKEFDEYRQVVSHGKQSAGEHGPTQKLPEEGIDGKNELEVTADGNGEDTVAEPQASAETVPETGIDLDTTLEHVSEEPEIEEVDGEYELTFKFGREDLIELILNEESPEKVRKAILEKILS